MIKHEKNPMSGDPSYLDEEKGIYYGWIVGGLVWPSENPGAVVIVGQEDTWRPPMPAHVLSEFEEATIGDLLRKCSYLTNEYCVQDFYGRPDQTCLRYVDQFNSEANEKRLKPFYFNNLFISFFNVVTVGYLLLSLSNNFKFLRYGLKNILLLALLSGAGFVV